MNGIDNSMSLSRKTIHDSTGLLGELLAQYHPRNFDIRLWDGTIWPADPGVTPEFTFVLRTPTVLRDMLWKASELALAEAFISGDLEIDGAVLGELRGVREQVEKGLAQLRLVGVDGPEIGGRVTTSVLAFFSMRASISTPIDATARTILSQQTERFERVSSHRSLPLLPTTVVGSYPQPNWLVDREKLRGRGVPPRVRMREVWRIPEPYLEEAQDDATVLAIRDMERAGIDIVTDGEMRRESYSNHFSNALDGVDVENPAQGLSRRGRPDILPRIVGPVRRRHPVNARDVKILRAATDHTIKITVPGPFTMSQQAVDEYYGDEAKLAMDLAAALNEEIHDLVAAGADVIQIDEPYMQARLDQARAFAIPAIDRSLEGVSVTTVLHTCFGYGALVGQKGDAQYRAYPFLEELAGSAVQQLSIEAAQPQLDLSVLARLGDKTVVLGVVDLGSDEVEAVEVVAARIRAALQHLPPERLVLAPDCGMKYLSRAAAFGKLAAMAEAARLVRSDLGAR